MAHEQYRVGDARTNSACLMPEQDAFHFHALELRVAEDIDETVRAVLWAASPTEVLIRAGRGDEHPVARVIIFMVRVLEDDRLDRKVHTLAERFAGDDHAELSFLSESLDEFSSYLRSYSLVAQAG